MNIFKFDIKIRYYDDETENYYLNIIIFNDYFKINDNLKYYYSVCYDYKFKYLYFIID